ncbi:MAG: DUF5305 family protein [Candidatus Verstraetearchaeota archaeon]|nr:DUF5305 family protein [Candidatus Verstraetearchaeota archaeon]
MRVSILKIAIIVFVITSIINAIGLFYAYQSPTETVEITTKAAYRHSGSYDFVAHLAPNLIYNRTEVGPEVQRVYTNLLEWMDLRFEYGFVTNASISSLDTELSLKVAIESPNRWSRELSPAEASALLNLSMGGREFYLAVNKSALDAFVKVIDLETGTSTTEYNLKITPTISSIAVTSAGTVQDSFVPQANVSFKQDIAGRYLTVSPINTIKDGKLVDTKKVVYESVSMQRILFAVALVASLVGLGVTWFMRLRKRLPKGPSETVKQILGANKDIIVEAGIEEEEALRRVEVRDFEELKKLAEILARPILHTLIDKEHHFSVIDNGTKYTYKVSED